MTDLYDRAGNALRWIYDRRIDAPPILDAARLFPNGSRFTAAWQALRDGRAARDVLRTLAAIGLHHEHAPVATVIGRDRFLLVHDFVE